MSKRISVTLMVCYFSTFVDVTYLLRTLTFFSLFSGNALSYMKRLCEKPYMSMKSLRIKVLLRIELIVGDAGFVQPGNDCL